MTRLSLRVPLNRLARRMMDKSQTCLFLLMMKMLQRMLLFRIRRILNFLHKSLQEKKKSRVSLYSKLPHWMDQSKTSLPNMLSFVTSLSRRLLLRVTRLLTSQSFKQQQQKSKISWTNVIRRLKWVKLRMIMSPTSMLVISLLMMNICQS